MKRAQYFLTANGQMADGLRFTQDSLLRNLIAAEQSQLPQPELQQLSLFDSAGSLRESHPMNEEMIYLYDGSFEGLLCCIF